MAKTGDFYLAVDTNPSLIAMPIRKPRFLANVAT